MNVGRAGHVNITGNCTFAGTSNIHLQVGRLACLVVAASYTVAGTTPQTHWNLTNNGVLIVNASLTISLSGTPAFSTAFIMATKCATTNTAGISWSGTATGVRYNVQSNAVVDTGGGGANYFPGNAAGSTATGGQYI